MYMHLHIIGSSDKRKIFTLIDSHLVHLADFQGKWDTESDRQKLLQRDSSYVRLQFMRSQWQDHLVQNILTIDFLHEQERYIFQCVEGIMKWCVEPLSELGIQSESFNLVDHPFFRHKLARIPMSKFRFLRALSEPLDDYFSPEPPYIVKICFEFDEEHGLDRTQSLAIEHSFYYIRGHVLIDTIFDVLCGHLVKPGFALLRWGSTLEENMFRDNKRRVRNWPGLGWPVLLIPFPDHNLNWFPYIRNQIERFKRNLAEIGSSRVLDEGISTVELLRALQLARHLECPLEISGFVQSGIGPLVESLLDSGECDYKIMQAAKALCRHWRENSLLIRTTSPAIIGANGLKVGDCWPRLRAARHDGAHGGSWAGIYGNKSLGVCSVVISCHYADLDIDDGDTLEYSSVIDLKNLTQDPHQLRSTHWMKISIQRKTPVRVLRGANENSLYSPRSGYRYDGLYYVDSYREVSGVHSLANHLLFRLVRLDGQESLDGFKLSELQRKPKRKYRRVGRARDAATSVSAALDSGADIEIVGSGPDGSVISDIVSDSL